MLKNRVPKNYFHYDRTNELTYTLVKDLSYIGKMHELVSFSLSVFTGIIAIMNPIANVPIFSSLVDGAPEEEQRKIAKKSTFTAFIIVCAFVLLGKFIFELFGITIPAFKITGGLLIFKVGFDMLESKKSGSKHVEEPNLDENIAISPLAIPILAGPGTIVTAANFVSDGGLIHIGIVIAVFAFICFLTYLAFIGSEKIIDKVGQNVITVIGKIMGLILAIIGTTMLIEGIQLAFDLS